MQPAAAVPGKTKRDLVFVVRMVSVMAAVLGVFSDQALAQMIPPLVQNGQPGSDLSVIGGGWDPQGNLSEVTMFARDIALTLALAALIIFHPMRRRMRRTLEDLMVPRLFFLYALIGMAVGFLVIQHGYIIGFVIFGIGALLRFRSTLDNAIDTVEVILVTVIGLSVGLGLPVMAILLGVVGWGLIWAAGRRLGYEIILHCKGATLLAQGEAAVRALIADRGWTCVSTHHVPAKKTCEFILVVSGDTQPDDFENAVTANLPAQVDCRTRF